MPIHYKNREEEFTRLYSDNDVMQMFVLYRDSPHVVLYVDELVVPPISKLWLEEVYTQTSSFLNDASAGSNKNNLDSIEKGKTISDPTGENILGTVDASEDSDSTYNGETVESTDDGSDFEYFIDDE